RRDPNTPLAPTIRTDRGRSLDIVEQYLLIEQLAGPGMGELKFEQKARPGNLAMADSCLARHQPCGQPQAKLAELQKVMIADECDPILERLDPQRHAQPASEIFFEACHAGEPLGAVDHLREPAAPG